MPLANPLNYCRPCGNDFGSVTLFDAHRVGKHEYTHAEGLQRTPPRSDGRRCLTVDEMHEKGWERNARERWIDPEKVAQARKAFPKP